MDLATVNQVFVCSLFIVLVLLSRPAMCGEVEVEGGYNYNPKGKNGPYHWGDIRPEWFKCKNGSMQSPINLQDNMLNLVVSNSELQRNYQPSNATLMSTGHSIKIEDDLRFIAQNNDVGEAVGIVDPKQIIRTISSKYYRYNGSLTTPPCDENVVWTTFQEVKTVTWEQVRLLQVAIRDELYANARPLQPINGRLVQLYVPTDHQ